MPGPASVLDSIGRNVPILPNVAARPLPVIVLFPRDSTVPARVCQTLKVRLFAKTQCE